MKAKPVIITVALAAALVVWNLSEFPDYSIDASKVNSMPIPREIAAPQFDWTLLDQVEVDVREGVCTLVSLPPELEELDGKQIVVAGPSFACGEDLEERRDGYTIHGFVMIPYFGMIDCCVGNPIPYFQWTVVVEKLATPWEINHKGTVDPNVVVQGKLRIERGESREGIFFLEQAEVIRSADAELAVAQAE